jgi:putative transposase
MPGARPREGRPFATNRALVDHIKRVHRDTSGCYGSPRIHVESKAQGRGARRGRIERSMRRHGISAIMARPRPGCEPPTAIRPADRTESARPRLQRQRSEPGLARRYHIHRDRSGLALSGRRHGPVQPQDCRLGDGGLPLAALRMAISAQRPGRRGHQQVSRLPVEPLRPPCRYPRIQGCGASFVGPWCKPTLIRFLHFEI